MFILSLLIIVISIIIFLNKTGNNYKKPPMVKGSIPILGHTIAFNKDVYKFIKEAYKKYGKIFKIQIFLI